MSDKTLKLYYENAYISSFTANVVEITSAENGYDVVLDKTAFFPEEGGQSSDRGYIGDVRVIHVYEKCGVIHHITDQAVTFGEKQCKIDLKNALRKCSAIALNIFFVE